MITCAAELTDGGYRVDYVADQPLTPTHQGLPLVANTTWPALEPHDLVVVPGWKTQVVPDPLNDQMLGHVAAHWACGGHVASICAGALLARAGILDDPTNPPLTLDELGRRLGMAGRALARHFKAATGLTSQAYVTAARREHATALHDRGWTWQAAARAVGYADARSLRHRD